MLVLVRFTLFFIMNGSLLLYLFTNIKLFKEGSPALDILAFSVLLGSMLIIVEIIFKQKIYLKKSSILLIPFFIYFITNVAINLPDRLVPLLFGTSGGVILFYTLGSLISINFLYIKENVLSSVQFLNIFNFYYILFSFFFLGLFLDTFITLVADLRMDLFLLSTEDGNYQRPGAFISIGFFIYSIMTAFFIFINKYAKRSWFVVFIFFVLYFLLDIGCMLLSQMMGSNNTLVNLGGLLFATTMFYVFINFTKHNNLLNSTKINIKKIFFSKLSSKLFSSILLSIIIIFTLLIGLISFFDIDLDKFRIFGFGAREVSSINSRIALFDNFLVHFDYNPVFGNMAVDILTTGEGSYVHSFVASLLTHSGMVGFMLFFLYLFVAIREKMHHYDNFYVNNLFTLYSLIVFAGIFAVASVGVFIAYSPIWFLFGLLFPPIIFNSRKEKQIE